MAVNALRALHRPLYAGRFSSGHPVTVDGSAVFFRQDVLERAGHCFGDDDYRIFNPTTLFSHI
jgi:hypothetical protein